MAPVQIYGIGSSDGELEIVGSDESDFFTHGEEEFEGWSIFQFSNCHHESHSNTIISPERCSITFQDPIFFYDGHTFSFPIMWFSGDTDHVHVAL